MTAEQKRRFYTGDLSSVDEVYQNNLELQQEKLQIKQDEEDRKRQQKAAKQLEKEERRERERMRKQEQLESDRTAQTYTQQLLGGPNTPFLKAVPNQQAQQDGHRNRA